MATYVVTNPQLYCSLAHKQYLSAENPGMMVNGEIICLECLEGMVGRLRSKAQEHADARSAITGAHGPVAQYNG